jgi:hypothetical protein
MAVGQAALPHMGQRRGWAGVGRVPYCLSVFDCPWSWVAEGAPQHEASPIQTSVRWFCCFEQFWPWKHSKHILNWMVCNMLFPVSTRSNSWFLILQTLKDPDKGARSTGVPLAKTRTRNEWPWPCAPAARLTVTIDHGVAFAGPSYRGHGKPQMYSSLSGAQRRQNWDFKQNSDKEGVNSTLEFPFLPWDRGPVLLSLVTLVPNVMLAAT